MIRTGPAKLLSNMRDVPMAGPSGRVFQAHKVRGCCRRFRNGASGAESETAVRCCQTALSLFWGSSLQLRPMESSCAARRQQRKTRFCSPHGLRNGSSGIFTDAGAASPGGRSAISSFSRTAYLRAAVRCGICRHRPRRPVLLPARSGSSRSHRRLWRRRPIPVYSGRR